MFTRSIINQNKFMWNCVKPATSINMLQPKQFLFANQMRQFAFASRYNGTNNFIRVEKAEHRKYGMKRHFYDNLHIMER